VKAPSFYFNDHPLAKSEKQLTTKELARHLRVSARTLASWRSSGKIPYWKLSARALRYELSAVYAALKKPDWPNE
jgi:excisionase family DNA binding protein